MKVLELGLLASTVCLVLTGCYGSNGQAKDGQSHWLDRCSEVSDCEDEQLCACGVCTIACDEPAKCGAEGLCADVEEGACGELRGAPERACFKSCSEDVDCNASGIVCRTGACVSVGALSELDASASERDANAPDAGDVTTVIDLDLGGGLGETQGVKRFVLAGNSLIWETTTAATEDGYIFSLDLESDEITLLARPPISDSAETQLEVQGDLLFYATGPDVHVLFLSAGTEAWSLQSVEPDRPIWTTDDSYIYYIPSSQPSTVWRTGHDGTPGNLVYSGPTGSAIRALCLDAESVYVEETTTAMSTRVIRVGKSGEGPRTFVDAFRVPLGYLTVPLAFFVHEGLLISDRGMHAGIQAHALEDAELRELTSQGELAAASSASGAYVYFAESTNPDSSSGQLFVSRVNMSSGETERLEQTSGFASQVVTYGGYLYWLEHGRVLRRELE